MQCSSYKLWISLVSSGQTTTVLDDLTELGCTAVPLFESNEICTCGPEGLCPVMAVRFMRNKPHAHTDGDTCSPSALARMLSTLLTRDRVKYHLLVVQFDSGPSYTVNGNVRFAPHDLQWIADTARPN